MSGRILLRIGIIVLVIGLLAWFAIGTGKPREYDQILEHGIYRATVSNVDEFTLAEARTRPRTVSMVIPKDQDRVEPWATIVQYAFRGHMRVSTIEVPPDNSELTFAQIADAIKQIESYKHLPVLMIGPDSVRLGEIAAAHRLVIEKLPLEEVERLAALPDATPETVRKVQEFARKYDQALREVKQKSPTTAPAPSPAPATVPAK